MDSLAAQLSSSYIHTPAPVKQTLSTSLVSETAEIKYNVCVDNKTKCPDGSKCCEAGLHKFGCCPMTDAVCCSDHRHCCPSRHKCVKNATLCVPTDSEVLRVSGFSTKLTYVCPDRRFSCANNETCCLMSSGDFGCCPFPLVNSFVFLNEIMLSHTTYQHCTKLVCSYFFSNLCFALLILFTSKKDPSLL
ncbi:unnamed protein product [Protopolystoma xenopodis]|uniref:Granulins domain-containing protein n=1 Tax=Protopolystoma xenopodis TaxID=117903 RepID=A0A3S5CGK1_9PLAT|nr:unnamed protein product [Protopolystoma xenopodis]